MTEAFKSIGKVKEAEECFELIDKLLRNIVEHSEEEKYR
jgi:hypothetical protein